MLDFKQYKEFGSPFLKKEKSHSGKEANPLGQFRLELY